MPKPNLFRTVLLLSAAAYVTSQESIKLKPGGSVEAMDESWLPTTKEELECYTDARKKGVFNPDDYLDPSKGHYTTGSLEDLQRVISQASCGTAKAFSQKVRIFHLTSNHVTGKETHANENQQHSIYHNLQEISKKHDPIILMEGLERDMDLAYEHRLSTAPELRSLLARYFPSHQLPERFEDLSSKQREVLAKLARFEHFLIAANHFSNGKVTRMYKTGPKGFTATVLGTLSYGKYENLYGPREKMAIGCAKQAVAEHHSHRKVADVMIIYGASHDFRRFLNDDTQVQAYTRIVCHRPKEALQAYHRDIGAECPIFQRLRPNDRTNYAWQANLKLRRQAQQSYKTPHR